MNPEKNIIKNVNILSQEDFEGKIQSSCLDTLSNTGFGEMIVSMKDIYGLNDFEDISNIPISPELIPDKSNSEIILSSNVTDKYYQLVETINNSETAKEYPFLLLGKIIPDTVDSVMFYDLIPCHKDGLQLKSSSVEYDIDTLLKSAKKYNVIAIGHTHPLLHDDEISNTLASIMKDEDKEKFKVKRTGLNLSTQDIYQSMFVQEQLPDNKILECVIMYNGDFILVDTGDEELSKYLLVYGDDNGEVEIPVPAYSV